MRDKKMSKFQDNLTRLGFKTYDEYLLSSHWIDFKTRYRTSGRSQVCAVCSHSAIQLHHHTYVRLGAENYDDVTPLCWRHHEDVHEWLETSGKTFVRYTSEAVAFLRGQLPTQKLVPKPAPRKRKSKRRQKHVFCPKCGRARKHSKPLCAVCRGKGKHSVPKPIP